LRSRAGEKLRQQPLTSPPFAWQSLRARPERDFRSECSGISQNLRGSGTITEMDWQACRFGSELATANCQNPESREC
jgi:hypothetical protein